MTLSTEISHQLLFTMKRICAVEETIADNYSQWQMRCPTHLSIGQEAVASVVGQLLHKDDLAVSSHRAHAHYLAKGGDLNAMIAEIYGKQTGCSQGRGGSMHLVDKGVGFVGSTAIVAGTIPVGTGLALGMKIKNMQQISCVFFGDGAIEEGVFYESANFAVLQQLPVLFICENNLYSVYSPLAKRQPKGRNIAQLAQAIGLSSFRADGNDVLQIYAMIKQAIKSLRSNKGPVFIEFSTYRWREHCGPNFDNNIGYRSEEEFKQWQAKDPIRLFQEHLITEQQLDESAIRGMQYKINQEIKEAFKFAKNSAFPSSESFANFTYAN